MRVGLGLPRPQAALPHGFAESSPCRSSHGLESFACTSPRLCYMLVTLQFWVLCGSSDSTVPLGITLLGDHCGSSTSVTSFYLGHQAVWYILWSLGECCHGPTTCLFCKPKKLAPHEYHQGLLLVFYGAEVWVPPRPAWATTGASEDYCAAMWEQRLEASQGSKPMEGASGLSLKTILPSKALGLW